MPLLKIKILFFFLYFLYLTSTPTSQSTINVNFLSSKQGISIQGDAEPFGKSSANLGDINGDGIDDFAVGSPLTLSGTVYVFYGNKKGLSSLNLATISSLMANNQGFKIQGLSLELFGVSVSSAGDINGDGVGDILIGSSEAFSGKGAAFVIFGRKGGLADITIDTTSSLTIDNRGFKITGTATQLLGEQVNRVGDVNGDGIDDIGIGAPTTNPNCGATYIIYGSKTNLNDIDVTLSPNYGYEILGSTGHYLGQLVAPAGDVNRDGIDDLIFGGPGIKTPILQDNAGAAYILYGSKTRRSDIDLGAITSLMDDASGFQILGSAGSYFGRIGGTIGDINGDGIPDLAVGCPVVDSSWSGIACIFYGDDNSPRADMDLSSMPSFTTNGQGFCIVGQASGYGLFSISGIGDFNGDDIEDFIIGVNQDSITGIAFVIYGSKARFPDVSLTAGSDITEDKGFRIEGLLTEPRVKAAGDINGDLAPDILITTQGITGSNSPGVAYVLYGTYPGLEALITVVSVINTAAQSTFMAAVALSIINFSNPGAIILITLTDGLFFYKYLKINYPRRLRYFLENCQVGSTIFDDLLSMPQDLLNQVPQYELSGKFETYDDFHSSFLVNFWASLLKLSFIALLAVLLWIFKPCFPTKVSKNDPKIKRFMHWFYTGASEALRWNLLLSMFTGAYEDIGIFTALEAKTIHFGTFLEWLSFIMCILLNFIALVIQIKAINVIQKLQRANSNAIQKKNPKIFETAKSALSEYQIIFETYKESSFLSQGFLLFYNIKIYIFFAIIAYVPNNSIVPTSVNSVIGAIMLLYLVFVRPMKSKIDLIQSILTELIVEIINICTFILAVSDPASNNSSETRENIGVIIITCNTIFMALSAVFLLIQLLGIFYNLYKVFFPTKPKKENHYIRNNNIELASPRLPVNRSPRQNVKNNGHEAPPRPLVPERVRRSPYRPYTTLLRPDDVDPDSPELSPTNQINQRPAQNTRNNRLQLRKIPVLLDRQRQER